MPGLADSKKLTERKRELLCVSIKQQAIAWSVAVASVAEIDQMNILQASLLAMKRAVEALSVIPDKVMVDGNQYPRLLMQAEAVVNGDQLIPAISAASIIAKVTRDQLMVALDAEYPGYGFKQHKGYPTKLHMEALERLGISAVHRRSFAPVKRIVEQYANA